MFVHLCVICAMAAVCGGVTEGAIPELFQRKPPEGNKEACGTGCWGLDLNVCAVCILSVIEPLETFSVHTTMSLVHSHRPKF